MADTMGMAPETPIKPDVTTTTTTAPRAPLFTIEHDFKYKSFVLPMVLVLAAWFGFKIIIEIVKSKL